MKHTDEKNALAREVAYLVDALKTEWQKSKNPVAYMTIDFLTALKINEYVNCKIMEMEEVMEDPDLPLKKSIMYTKDNYIRLRLLMIVIKAQNEMTMKNLKEYGISLDEEDLEVFKEFKKYAKKAEN